MVFPFLLIILFSCHENRITKRGNVSIADLDSMNISEFRYSNLYKRVIAIALDNKEIMLAEISKMFVYKDELYLLDRKTQGVYTFLKDGSFVRKFGNLGVGPGEYVSCKDFTINTDANEIYIYDRIKNRIYIYDIVSGSYKRYTQIVQGVRIDYIHYNGGYLYAVQASNRNKKKEDSYYLLYQIDIESGKKIAQWLDATQYNKGWNDEFIHGNIFYKIKENEDLFVMGLMDSIMCIKRNEIFPFLAIKSERLIQEKDILEEEKKFTSNPMVRSRNMISLLTRLSAQNKYCQISNVFKHNSMLYFTCMSRFASFVQYDENRQTTSVYSQVIDDVLFRVIPNHFQVPKFLLADEAGVYYYVPNENLSELKYFMGEKKMSERLVNGENIEKANEDSNPIILYYEYKD